MISKVKVGQLVISMIRQVQEVKLSGRPLDQPLTQSFSLIRFFIV